MDNVTRTIAGAYLQTIQWIGANFQMATNSTLNEKFDIQAGITPANGQIPRLSYFGIGNGGHDLVVGANQIAKIKPSQFKSRSVALYNHLPFVLCLPDADLTTDEAKKYALRKIISVNGQNYVAYYLKRLDFSDTVPSMNYHEVLDDKSEMVTPFVFNSSDLNPTKEPLSPTGVNVTTGDYLSASAPVVINFTPDDIGKLVNVALILFNDADLAIISEMCFVSGVDKVVASPGVANQTINFKEAIAAQVNVFINLFYQLNFNNEGININVDVGTTEPLFQLGGVSA